MIVLALDTTGPDCSVCLRENETVLAYITERIGRGHAERLAPMVADVFAKAGLIASDIDRLAVCTGPGSFTGLRVALSLAKGFALPRRLPVLGVDALRIEAVRQETDVSVIMRDVRRGQVFAAAYKLGEPLTPPAPMSLQEAEALAAEHNVSLSEAETADMPTLAGLAMTLDPADYPAVPLYARAPDAKLPGGRLPQPV